MVHIDGDHSYEGVAGDIEVWSPRVFQGGILSFHDYFIGESPPHNPSGAGQAVREFIETDDHFEEILFVDRLKAFRKKGHDIAKEGDVMLGPSSRLIG
jgi:hypothetical protein